MTPIDVALAELAKKIREDKGDNLDSAGRIAEFNKVAGWKGGPRIPYCATTVSFCFITAEWPIGGMIDGKRIEPGTASCYALSEWFKNDPENVGAVFLPSSEAPEPNDVVFINTKQDGAYNHVGIVERRNFAHFWTIEGNTSNAGIDEKPDTIEAGKSETNDPTNGGVHRRCRKVGASYISGFGRIKNVAGKSVTITPSVIQKTTSNDIVALMSQLTRPGQVAAIQTLGNALDLYLPGMDGSVDDKMGPATRKMIKLLADKIISIKE